VQPAFHKKQVEGYASTIEQYTQELLQSWHTGDILDMSSAMQALTLRIVSKCLFSLDLSNQLSALGDNFNAMLGNSTSTAEDLLNIHIDNTVTGYGKRLAATRQLDRIIYTLIAQRRENNHEQNDMLSMLITAPSGATPETNLTDKQIRDHMLTFLAAGHETTAISLTWTFYLLSKYPQVREKLQDELRSVLAGRTPTMDDLTKLPYLEWVLNESMRLYPPAWMQARFVVQDFELDGVHIPAGTMIMLSQWVIHRLPEFWDEPETFRPERWDPDHSETITPGAYFPFGGGPRMCIGMPFAQLEAKMVLALILQRYTPQAVPGYNPGLKPTITLRPKHNLRTTLLPADLNSTSAQWKQLISVPEATLTRNEERDGCLGAMLSLFGLL
jgi:cytochrome P450